jgi:hypothetical protein
MGKECSTHGRKRNETVLVGKPEGKRSLEVAGRILERFYEW